MKAEEFNKFFVGDICSRPFWNIKIKSADVFCNTESCYGVPILVSDNFLMIGCIEDFIFDGYEIVRMADITEILTGEVELFTSKVLKDEGINFNKVALPINNIDTYCSIFNELKEKGMSVEVKGYTDATIKIGQVINAENTYVTIKEYDGVGVWHDDISQIAYDDIREITFNTRYINTMNKYTRYLDDKN